MRGTSDHRFPKTSWSLILAAGGSLNSDSGKALQTLCRIYWNPVYAFIRRSGHDPEKSMDLTQSFFALLLEKNYVKAADQQRGRFRSFLLTAVKHFLANEWDRDHALKRGGGQIAVSIDTVQEDRWYALAAVEDATPENLFERRWALSLLEQVMSRLRAEFAEAGKSKQFELLVNFLTQDKESARYQAVATQMGVSCGALRMAVHRMRRRYKEILYAEVSETVSTAEEIEEEIRFLLSTLSGSGNRGLLRQS
jgi:DNA-directed RNA polymerase specialized sigma24 family protein